MTAAEPAPPTDGLREEIAELIYDRDSLAGDLHWSRTHPEEQKRCRYIADAVLALPRVQRLTAAEAAPPTDGLREAVAAAIQAAASHWRVPINAWGGEDLADAVLTLPRVQWLLAAEAAVRRVEALADEMEGHTRNRDRRAAGSYDDGVNLAQADAAARIRRALDGDQ